MVAFQWDATRNIRTYGSNVMRFLRFQPKLGHAVSHCQCSKICPKMKLWNSAKNRDFSIFIKTKFVRVEEALEHLSTVRIFNPRIFHMLFLLPKNGLCMWISAYPLAENDFFLNVPHLLWVWDFEDMYLTHLETRIWRGTFHIYFKKWFFWPSKLCCPLWALGENFFVNFERYDLANGKEWVCKIWWTCRHRS
jgi:hypothetical protein